MNELTIAGELTSLEAIAQFVQQLAAQAGLNRTQSYNLRLAIDEISSNIILHGYQESGRQGLLEFQAVLTDQALMVILEDTGAAYHPHAIQESSEPHFQTPLEARPMGGLGVYLALRSVDEFHYERIGDRNRTRFVINRI